LSNQSRARRPYDLNRLINGQSMIGYCRINSGHYNLGYLRGVDRDVLTNIVNTLNCCSVRPALSWDLWEKLMKKLCSIIAYNFLGWSIANAYCVFEGNIPVDK
jgi:hypothetical protein